MTFHFINVQYCYNYLLDQIPIGLLLYSHIPTAIVAVLFGAFVVTQARKLSGTTLFIVCLMFAGWCAADLASWFAFLGSGITMFTWTLVDLFAVSFFFFAYYFLYTFITERDLPLWQKLGSILILAPTFVYTFLGSNLTSYDANTCEAIEQQWIVLYPYVVEVTYLVAVLAIGVWQYKRAVSSIARRKTVLATIGVTLFLLFFFSATLAVNLLVNYDAAEEFAYNYGIYGLFGMPILLGYLGYLIVRYHAFDLRVFGAQALTVALAMLLAAEIAFTSSSVNLILIAITLFLTMVVGVILIRSVRREIDQRQRIEKLAHELEETNRRQESLIHFVGHEVKGFLTKDMSAFAALTEGDYGPLPDGMKPFVEGALASSRDGARSVIEILQASNQKKGTVEYKKEPFDMKALAEEWYGKLKEAAAKKNLALNLSIDAAGEPYTVNGDHNQLGDHVLRNLIENSINYTPSGSVSVSLSKKAGKIIFAVKDTGVGISPEDKKRLFTEGGHGKDSIKVNAHSTGYGLFIAKNVVTAHGGTIGADSDGPGKGSTFTVELPAA